MSLRYHGDNDIRAMLDIVVPLHEQLEKGASTAKEEQFHKAFGEDLTQAWTCIKKYRDRTQVQYVRDFVVVFCTKVHSTAICIHSR